MPQGMDAPRQMTAHTLNALKGWPAPAAVDFHTEFSPTVFQSNGRQPVLAGSVLHLNGSGKYELGVGQEPVMPLFSFNSSDDPDVYNPGGDPAQLRGNWVAIAPTGQSMSLVAIGGYELTSTEFIRDAYAPNDPLTSPLQGEEDAGRIKKGVLYEDMIVGFVSRGTVDNGYGHAAVAFWPFPVFPLPTEEEPTP